VVARQRATAEPLTAQEQACALAVDGAAPDLERLVERLAGIAK
jgi:hypothetical protein